jgi:hypothetical protein
MDWSRKTVFTAEELEALRPRLSWSARTCAHMVKPDLRTNLLRPEERAEADSRGGTYRPQAAFGKGKTAPPEPRQPAMTSRKEEAVRGKLYPSTAYVTCTREAPSKHNA